MPTTHVLAAGTMAAELAAIKPRLNLIADTIVQSAEEKIQARHEYECKTREEAKAKHLAHGAPRTVTTLLDFMEMLKGVPTAKRFVCWTMVNALNNAIIGQAQAHLRSQRSDDVTVEDPAFAGMAIEDRNRFIEAWSREKEEINRLRDEHAARNEQGHETPDTPEEVLSFLVNLRELIAQPMVLDSLGDPRGLPQNLVDSIAFRLKDEPKLDAAKCMRMHLESGDDEATRISLADIKRIEIDSQMTDRKRLLADASTIVELAASAKLAGLPNNVDSALFDLLPAHIALRLIGTVCRMLSKALDAETRAYLRFGRQSALAGRTIVSACLDGYKAYFSWFEQEHGDELAAFEERGGMLKSLEEWLAPA